MAEKAVLEVMLTYERPFIVLCQNRGEAEGLARLCAAYFGVEKIRFYHSELTDEEKKAVEEWFCASEDGILTTSGALGIKICLSGIAGVIQTGSQEVSDVFMKDKEFAFNFIRKNRRLYTWQEAVHELTELFNRKKLKTFGINVWDAKDTAEILSQLLSEERLRICGTFWKDRLDIIKQKKRGRDFLSLIPRRHLHRLYFLRRNFQLVQERVQRLFS